MFDGENQSVFHGKSSPGPGRAGPQAPSRLCMSVADRAPSTTHMHQWCRDVGWEVRRDVRRMFPVP